MTNTLGLDLSKWNGRGDWQAVKAAGVNFVYIKAGGVYSNTGVCYTDNLLADHAAGAGSVDIPFGLYWFFLPFTPVSTQDVYFQKLINQYKPQLPPAIDIESNNGQAAKLITSTLKEMAYGFSDFARPPLIYTRASWFNANVLADPLWGQCDLWASRWKSGLTSPWSDGCYKFRDWKDWRFWQISGDNNARAREFGFPGPPYGDPDIDINVFNGDENSFREWAGLEHVPTIEERLTDLERRVTNLGG